ncbi:MAG: xanthine dehydrogenase family protein subunit M [Pseudomonadota bacterium]
MYDFDYLRAGSVAEAASALAATPNAKLLAGGQTYLPTLKQRLANPSCLIDLGGIGELKSIEKDGTALVIGAMATHAEVAVSPIVREALPGLAGLAGGIGDPQVRHNGTIGGSLANNDPAADYPSAALALNATIVTNKREIVADDYFQGIFTTALEDDEIITQIRFPLPDFAGYAKQEQRASRYPLVGVFVARLGSSGEIRVAVTGAGNDGVFRVDGIEKALAANFSADAAKSVAVASAALMGDMHGSAEYRAHLIPVLAGRAVAAGVTSSGS